MIDLDNKIVFITGSTDGIGKETAIELVKVGAYVIIHGRNEEKGKKTFDEIKDVTKSKKLDYLWADLTNFNQIREMAKVIHEKVDHIDILINNAGVYMESKKLTDDGFEYTFAINHLSHFLLTNLLLDLIKKGNNSRIVNISSQVQLNKIDFDNLNAEKKYNSYNTYALSKTCNAMFTYDLADRLKDSGVTVNCLHPGVINTKLLNAGFGMIGSGVNVGAENVIFVANSPELKKITGKYFKDKITQKSSRVTYDLDARKKLWEISEKLTNINYK